MTDRVKRPAFQWYPGDFRRDLGVQACSFEARALWREMLDLMHDGEPYGHLTAGGVPISTADLARLVGKTAKVVEKWVDELESRKVFSRTRGGVIYSRRMVRDEDIRNKRAKGGPKSLENENVPRPKDPPKDGDKDTFDPSLPGSNGGSPAVAVAVAVAVEELSINQSALARQLDSDPDRAALARVVRSARNPESCIASLAGMLEGLGVEHAPTTAQLGRALQDFDANGVGWNAAHFRGYLTRAMAPRKPARAVNGDRGHSDPTLDALDEVGRKWAAEEEAKSRG